MEDEHVRVKQGRSGVPGLSREAGYDLFVQLCPQVFAVTLADTDRARILIAESDKIGVRDAIHAVVMLNNGISDIASFDTGFDDIKGIARLDLRSA